MAFSDVSGASSHFSQAYEGFSTTTSGTTASGATTVGLASVSGLTNGTVFVGVIEPAGVKEQIFTGIVDTAGSQITGVVWVKGSNVEHATGVTVVDYDVGAHHNLATKGILVSHNQSGTPKAGITYPASTFTTPTIADFTNAQHTHASAAQGGILTYSALLSTIFSGQIVSDSNPGAGGGSRNFLNLGGVKISWGITAQSAAIATNGVQNLAVTFPTTYAAAPTVFAANVDITADNRLGNNVLSVTTTTCVIAVASFAAGATATSKASWLAIGT